jgi:chromosome segregation ATPase
VLPATRTIPVALLALAMTPGVLTSQDPAPAQSGLPQEVQELVMEMQQIEAELAPVQEQALQDAELQEEQQRVSTAVQTTMLQLDPSLPERTERFGQLQEEARAAQESGDVQRIAELSAEAQEIQQHLGNVQAEAMQNPEVAPQLESFQSRLMARMIEIQPETEQWIQRLEELQQQVESALLQ